MVPRPKDTHVIGIKWIFKNKIDEDGEVVRNKSRLVAQGCTQVEGVDFDESFALIARLESIWILLSILCIMKFKLYQIDVKNAFLNGVLNEEVFVEQPIRTYVFHMLGTYVTILWNWLIFWQNALYLYLGRSRMCLMLQETSFQYQVLKPCKSI